MTPYTSDDFVEKGLAAAMVAGQNSSTTQDVNREERDVRTRFRQRATAQKAKDNTGRADLQAFAAALDAAMKRVGLKPAELARLVWGEMTDSRGYVVPRNRDRISSYLAAQSYPEPENVQKLADVLGIPVEEFASTRPPAPERPERPAPAEKPRRLSDTPSNILTTALLPERKMRIQMDKVLDWELVVQIQTLVLEAETGKTKINPEVE